MPVPPNRRSPAVWRPDGPGSGSLPPRSRRSWSSVTVGESRVARICPVSSVMEEDQAGDDTAPVAASGMCTALSRRSSRPSVGHLALSPYGRVHRPRRSSCRPFMPRPGDLTVPIRHRLDAVVHTVELEQRLAGQGRGAVTKPTAKPRERVTTSLAHVLATWVRAMSAFLRSSSAERTPPATSRQASSSIWRCVTKRMVVGDADSALIPTWASASTRSADPAPAAHR